MFRGFSVVNLDSKGRLAIPSRFRDRLQRAAPDALVLAPSPLDHSMWLYPLPDWEQIESKLAQLSDFDEQSRRTKQMMRGYATDCQLDTHGRILIPAQLREHAMLDKQVMVLGQGNRLELWNKAEWDAKRESWLRQVGEGAAAPSEALRSLSL